MNNRTGNNTDSKHRANKASIKDGEANQQRLFVALPLPAQIKQELQQWQHQNKATLRFRKWTHPDDLHITLQFLGDTSNAQLEQLIHHLSGIKQAPFRLQLSALGSFGPASAPRILWAAVNGELQSLTQLHKKVIAQTEKLGFTVDHAKFKPHITLARYFEQPKLDISTRSRNSIEEQTEQSTVQELLLNSALTALEWQADEFTIMKTTLHKQPSYSIIHRFTLATE